MIVNSRSSKLTGFVIKSNVTPHYLPYIAGWSQSDQYVEFINTDGLPEKLLAYGLDNDRYKYTELEFRYDNMNRLVNIKQNNVLQDGETAYPTDTMNYQLIYRSITDTKPKFKGYEKYKITFSSDFLFIKDFAFETYRSIGYGKLIEYDSIGRPVTFISYYDLGLDSEILYEKYFYNSNDLFWSSRRVHQVILKMDNEDLSIEKLKNELLIFPNDFEKEKKEFNQERKVERIDTKHNLKP